MAKDSELTVQAPPRAVGSLNDLRGIRREMIKVYRETRRGMLDTKDAARLVYVLREISRTIVEGELEERVTVLEDSIRKAT